MERGSASSSSEIGSMGKAENGVGGRLLCLHLEAGASRRRYFVKILVPELDKLRDVCQYALRIVASVQVLGTKWKIRNAWTGILICILHSDSLRTPKF